MKKVRVLKALASVSLVALACAGDIARAQEANDGSAGDIVVTARRVEERLQDVPISITVFSQQQISDRNIVSAGDLAAFTPSLSAQNRFGPESTSFSIRGFTQETQTTPSVGVYFADVVAPRAQGGTTAGNGAGPGALFDLQNVQVLKGPQGTLFGRNTTGGAVLLTPRKPSDTLEGYIEGSIGNYDLRRLQAVVNLPLSDTFRVRLGADRNKRDGYLRNISGIGPRHFADIDYWAARLSVVADLTPDLENYTIASFSQSKTNGSYVKIFAQDNIARDPFPGLRAAQIAATSGDFYDIANGNPTAGQNIRQWQVINTTTWRASDNLTVKNIISYAEFRQSQSTGIYGENPYQNGATLPYYAVVVIPKPGYDNVAQSTFTEELQVQGSAAGDRLEYQAGVYYEMANPLGFQNTYGPNGIACVDAPNLQCSDITGRGFVQDSATKYWFRNLGLYAQGTYKLAETLSVTGGIRYTRDKVSGLGRVLKYFFPTGGVVGGPIGYGCIQPANQVQGGTSAQIQADPSRCDFERQQKSARPTWLIGLDFKPNEDVLLYAKYARGYRQGAINVTSYGLETWGPEKVDTYEAGAKLSFDGAVRGNLNLAAFYNDFKDQQIAINTVSCQLVPAAPACAGIPAANFPASAQGIANGASSTIKGVEVDASIQPFEGFKLDAGYAYITTKLKRFPDLSVPPLGFAALFPAAILGGPLAMTPKHKLTASAAYTLPLGDEVGDITLSGTFTYQGRQLGSTASLPARQFLPSQRNLNLNLNWQSVAGKPIDISLFATNVTREKYYANLVGASFGWEAAILNEPRMFGARVKVRFGE